MSSDCCFTFKASLGTNQRASLLSSLSYFTSLVNVALAAAATIAAAAPACAAARFIEDCVHPKVLAGSAVRT